MTCPKKKYPCDECKKKYTIHSLVFIKGKQLCNNCRRKTKTSRVQDSAIAVGRGWIKLEDVLKRVYTAKLYRSTCLINLPLCMAEKKFKLVLVGE